MNPVTSDNQVSRRGFFQLTLGWIAATFAVCASAVGAVRFLVPNVLFEPSLVNRTSQGYHCPCHGSMFDDQGSVKSGPAPRALEWFSVTLSKDNRLLVNKSQRVNAEKYLVL